MQTKEKGLFYWILDRGVLQDEKLNTDVDRLTAFYHDNGYMDAKVGTPVVSRAKDGFTIEIPVEEGERYRVAAVAVTGDPLETEEKLEAKLETKPKQYFSREKVRHDVEYVGKQYMDQGYAYAEVIPQVQRDPATHTTRVDLNVKRGNKVHIERISISGNTKTRDNVIRRQMKLAEGDLFSGSKLERSNLNLKKLDFFEQFEIVPSEGTMADLMNLDVKVKEKSTGAVSVGGGYSSDDGFFIGGEVFQRNLFGKGQSLGVRAHLGQEAQRYSLNFNDPNFLDSQYSAGFDIYKWDREYTDFDKEAQGVVLRFGHPVGNWSRVSAAYNFENATVSDVDPCASLYVREQEGTLNKSSVALSIERDTTDHPFLPTRGSINSAALELSSKYIGSDSNFASYVVSSAWYVPLVWKFIGFVRGRAGYISEFYGDDPVPIYERFFLGGVNSHRAFDWGELGPRVPTACDPDDYDVIGGTKFGLVNVELLFPLVEKLSMRGVLFFDAGNAFDDNEAFKVEDFRPGAGAGIVWASPFGPLRFYWAYNLDRKVDEDQYKFQFAMGYYF
jgi:outer membrane protein insertion porin family